MLRLPTFAVRDEMLLIVARVAVRTSVDSVNEEIELVRTWAALMAVVEIDPIVALLPTYKSPMVLMWLLT